MIKDTNTEKTTNNNKVSTKEYIFAVGRRKSAVARVRLYPKAGSSVSAPGGTHTLKDGEILVNGESIEKYFASATAKSSYIEPLKATDTLATIVLSIKVEGGGRKGQLDAVVLGIARALSLYNKKFRPLLKKRGLLSRDSRVRERRKIGTGGKARRQKQSPKR